MSRFAQPSQDDSGYVLVARMDNAKNLSSILKAVHFREVDLYTLPECSSAVNMHRSIAGLYVFSEQPGPQSDGGTVKVCPSQRFHPGQSLPTVFISPGHLTCFQNQPVCTH